MTTEEILQTLKAAANFEMKREDFGWCGHGAINNFPECRVLGGMTPYEYARHYDRNRSLLESLPWSKVVEYPRNPREDSKGKIITPPIYTDLSGITATLFRARLKDHSSMVIIDTKGNVVSTTGK